MRTACSGVFKNGSSPLTPAGSSREFFSDTYCRNLVELLEVNLTVFWGFPMTGFPLEFLTPRFVHTELPSSASITVWGFLPNMGSHGGSRSVR